MKPNKEPVRPSRWRPDAAVAVVEGQKCAMIPLTQGKFAIVDLDMFEELNKWIWQTHNSGYAVSFCLNASGIQTTILMHRMILRTPHGLATDHANGNRLDNRRSNLRFATAAENRCNSKMYQNNTTGFKGVHFNKGAGRFEARIARNGQRVCLGLYSTAEQAHVAYSAAARNLHGEFARTQ